MSASGLVAKQKILSVCTSAAANTEVTQVFGCMH